MLYVVLTIYITALNDRSSSLVYSTSTDPALAPVHFHRPQLYQSGARLLKVAEVFQWPSAVAPFCHPSLCVRLILEKDVLGILLMYFPTATTIWANAIPADYQALRSTVDMRLTP